MITNITLENFKCFRHVSINPKLLTVLIGPNGTGKVQHPAGVTGCKVLRGWKGRLRATKRP